VQRGASVPGRHSATPDLHQVSVALQKSHYSFLLPCWARGLLCPFLFHTSSPGWVDMYEEHAPDHADGYEGERKQDAHACLESRRGSTQQGCQAVGGSALLFA